MMFGSKPLRVSPVQQMPVAQFANEPAHNIGQVCQIADPDDDCEPEQLNQESGSVPNEMTSEPNSNANSRNNLPFPEEEKVHDQTPDLIPQIRPQQIQSVPMNNGPKLCPPQKQ